MNEVCFYIVVAITASGMEREFITPAEWDKSGIVRSYNKRIRVYTTPGQARAYRTKLRKQTPSLKQGGADFSIFRVRINQDGTHESDWFE